MSVKIGIGHRLPDVRLARIEGGELSSYSTEALFAGRKVVIIGVPGAFTPVCSRTHIPQFVDLAPTLLSSGIDMVACLTPNDPWTTATWADQLDPDGRLFFLSDGNLDFGRAAGLTQKIPHMFLGERLARFTMIVQGCIVEKLNIERSPMELTCSAAGALAIPQPA